MYDLLLPEVYLSFDIWYLKLQRERERENTSGLPGRPLWLPTSKWSFILLLQMKRVGTGFTLTSGGIKILFHCHLKGNLKRHGFVSLCFVQAQPACGPSLRRRGGNMTSSSTASPPSSATSRVRCWHNKQPEYLFMRITGVSSVVQRDHVSTSLSGLLCVFRRASQEILPPVRPASFGPGWDLVSTHSPLSESSS